MILDLHRQGLGVSAIARRTGLDRKTVRKYIESSLEPPVYGPRQLRPTKVRPFEPYLRERVAAFPDLTGSRLHREIRDLGYAGGHTVVSRKSLCDFAGISCARSGPARRQGSRCGSRRRPVEVHSTAHELRILEDGQVVAVHPVLDGRGQRRIIAGHRTARAPANSQTSRQGLAPARTGDVRRTSRFDVVALRPLAFYDAVAKRLACKGTAA